MYCIQPSLLDGLLILWLINCFITPVRQQHTPKTLYLVGKGGFTVWFWWLINGWMTPQHNIWYDIWFLIWYIFTITTYGIGRWGRSYSLPPSRRRGPTQGWQRRFLVNFFLHFIVISPPFHQRRFLVSFWQYFHINFRFISAILYEPGTIFGRMEKRTRWLFMEPAPCFLAQNGVSIIFVVVVVVVVAVVVGKHHLCWWIKSSKWLCFSSCEQVDPWGSPDLEKTLLPLQRLDCCDKSFCDTWGPCFYQYWIWLVSAQIVTGK